MLKTKISILLVVALLATLVVAPMTAQADDSTYAGRFEEIYKNIYTDGVKNGYLSADEGVPYHSIETLIVEAPDYGHVTTSEAMSYLVWIAAMHGKITGDFSDVADAWETMEYLIPSDKEQPGFGNTSNIEASYADEQQDPAKYPVQFDHNNKGKNPIAQDLNSAYSRGPVYLMHWLADVDNWYGYGTGKDLKLINTFQRGEQESTWETIPHPSYEEFKYGGRNGFLDLFGGDGNDYAKQWRYTNAPDADLRAVQALYNAWIWSDKSSQIKPLIEKAAKMGDYSRNNLFDKYYKAIGCEDKSSPSAGYDSAHYLINWYTSWGGDVGGQWAFQIGCSHNHFFYQNPLAAWVLANDPDFSKGMKARNAVKDWTTSTDAQLEFIAWLQSDNGPIAGGVTNSWNGRYEKYPSGQAVFNKMAYDPHPVYKDPGSNKWFGTQVWGLQRVAELYYETGNTTAKQIMDKWVDWVKTEITFNSDGTFQIPSDLEWSGQPGKGLTAKVTSYGTDIGCTGSLANILVYYGVKANDDEAVEIAAKLVDYVWNLYRDDVGFSAPEKRGDYSRFFEQEVYVPSGYSGKMANGDEIKPGIKFIDIRTKYYDDPQWSIVEQAYENGEDPELSYHRFWHQADMAMALGLLATLTDKVPDTDGPTPTTGTSGDLGDVNEDGSVNSTDYALIKRHILGTQTLKGQALVNADVNKDGSVNSTDYALVKRYILGTITSF